MAISPVGDAVAGTGANVFSDFVTNDAAHPVPVTNVNDAQQPVTAKAYLNITDGNETADAPLYTVPAGKRFVLETVSMGGALPAGQKLEAHITGEPLLGSSSQWELVPTDEGVFNGTVEYFQASQQERIYFEPGEHLYADAARSNATGAGDARFDISGYLVNAS
jgi:hypothetical protein